MARWKRSEGSVFVSVELNEDQIPDLDTAGIIGVDETTLGVAVRREIDVKFGTGTAGTRLAHHPEVVLFVSVNNLDLRIEALFFKDSGPEVVGFLVELGGIAFGRGIDGRIEAIGRDAPPVRDQLPGPLDGFLLEVIAEAPVTEHFKEGVVVGVVTHILEIIVFAAGANAFLGVSSTWRIIGCGLSSEEIRDELIHPRVGEQQVRGCRHQASRGHHGVLLFCEKIEKGLPYFA